MSRRLALQYGFVLCSSLIPPSLLSRQMCKQKDRQTRIKACWREEEKRIRSYYCWWNFIFGRQPGSPKFTKENCAEYSEFIETTFKFVGYKLHTSLEISVEFGHSTCESLCWLSQYREVFWEWICDLKLRSRTLEIDNYVARYWSSPDLCAKDLKVVRQLLSCVSESSSKDSTAASCPPVHHFQ